MDDFFDNIKAPKKEKEKTFDDLLDMDDRDPLWYPEPPTNTQMPLDGYSDEIDFDEYIEFGD